MNDISVSSTMAFSSSHPFMFNTTEDHDHHLPSISLNNFPSLPPHHFQGGAPFLLKRSVSFSGIENKCNEVHGEEELSDDGLFQSGEKKKRLNLEQVKALEKSFELGNKLEAERKVQLAKALGLQPRQIAIWFQNRRARWKTKHLEKEFVVLKKQFEAAKADNDALKLQNQKLHIELQALKSKDWCEAGTISQHQFKKETEGTWSNGSENSSDINLELSRTSISNSPVSPQNNKSLLPTSLKPTSITQLLQFSSRPNLQDEEGFCNMFHSIDEHQNFWPWPEQHHFH